MMTTSDAISPETSKSLRGAAEQYAAAIEIPCFIEDVDGFAGAYLGAEESGLKTLVTGDEDGLAISVDGSDGKTRVFVNVDFDLPDGAPASIVNPGFYDKDGKPDNENGAYGRPVVRSLTEIEGQELTMDLHALMRKIPQAPKFN